MFLIIYYVSNFLQVDAADYSSLRDLGRLIMLISQRFDFRGDLRAENSGLPSAWRLARGLVNDQGALCDNDKLKLI